MFKRAVGYNNSKHVHLQLGHIHERNQQIQQATAVHDACSKKFPRSKKVWLSRISFFYRQKMWKEAREALPKCLTLLPARKHAQVVSKAAMLEYEHNFLERGRSLFEGLIDSHPKRTDLWSIYLDAHIKAHTPPKVVKPQFAEVRSLFERCCTFKLKPIKMRFFFKRWLEFEKKWGNAESQDMVRAKATEFVVENQTN